MDVNIPEWSRAEFQKLAGPCRYKSGVMCSQTGYARKDYLCPFIRQAKDINEVRQIFARQQED